VWCVYLYGFGVCEGFTLPLSSGVVRTMAETHCNMHAVPPLTACCSVFQHVAKYSCLGTGGGADDGADAIAIRHSWMPFVIHGLQKCPRTSLVTIRYSWMPFIIRGCRSWLVQYSWLGTGRGADDGGDAIHELGAVQHVGVVEHALLERHNDKLVCVGCQKVLDILLHDPVYILTPFSHPINRPSKSGPIQNWCM